MPFDHALASSDEAETFERTFRRRRRLARDDDVIDLGRGVDV
jgi:hypothetical protein